MLSRQDISTAEKTNSPLATIDDSKASLAGTFMHELGHTFGLTHGGGPDKLIEYKPNFISVMNYFHYAPWTGLTAQGTTGRDAWTLDYSRHALSSVNEEELYENQGLQGPLTCRQGNPPILRPCKILFNSIPVADPPDDTGFLITIGHPFLDEIDWNNDGIISSDPLMPTVDTNRPGAINRCTAAANPVVLENLDSHIDWNVLVLPPQSDSQTRSSDAPNGPNPLETREMDQFEYFTILEADWFDQTAPTDEMLKDGFEE